MNKKEQLNSVSDSICRALTVLGMIPASPLEFQNWITALEAFHTAFDFLNWIAYSFGLALETKHVNEIMEFIFDSIANEDYASALSGAQFLSSFKNNFIYIVEELGKMNT